MIRGQHVRRADGTVWQVAGIGTTIRAAHPGVRGEIVTELRLHRDGVDAWVCQYGHGQAERLRLPPAEPLTPVPVP